MMKNTLQRDRCNTGSALVVVLWVVGLLSIFVLAFAFDMHIEARITSTWRRKLQAEYLARSGLEFARMVMSDADDPALQNTDPLLYIADGEDEAARAAALAIHNGGSAEITRDLGKGEFTVKITPENSKIDLIKLINDLNQPDPEVPASLSAYERLASLFDRAGIPWEMRDILVDSLLDWVDQDELSRLNGAESDFYERLDPPYKSKNRMIDTVDELALIRGFDELVPETEQTVYDVVADYFTTYGDGKLNINGADLDTIIAYFGVDEQLAQQIIDSRAGPDGTMGTPDDEPYKSSDLSELQALLHLADAQSLTTQHGGLFNIQSMGKVQDVFFQINCCVRLADKDLIILQWTEGVPAR